MDYSSEVQQRFLAPRGAGAFEEGTPGLASGEAEDRTLNVWVRFQVDAHEGVIRATRFQVYGCPYTVAAAAWVAEWLEGRPLEALGQLDVHAVREALRVPPDRLGKLLRIQDAVEACKCQLQAGVAGTGQRQNGS